MARRAKDVHKGIVLADSMTYARKTSSGCRDRGIARCAKPNGLATTLLASALLLKMVSRRREEMEEARMPMLHGSRPMNPVSLRTTMIIEGL